MLITCWSAKGGVGTTVVAAGLALAAAHRPHARPPLLVDLAGDVPACLGVADPTGPGVADWAGAGLEVPPDALARLETEVTPGLRLLHRGSGPLDGERCALLAQVLSASRRTVVVDCGRVVDRTGVFRVLAEADRSLLVTRPCVMALKRAVGGPGRPTGVVVVRESGRTLGPLDVGACVGAPVVADLAVDPAVARAVDSGLLSVRLPRAYATALGRVVA